jgi:hypothetical protein
MSWKDCFELHDPHVICLLQAAKCSVIEVARVTGVTITIRNNAAVYTPVALLYQMST